MLIKIQKSEKDETQTLFFQLKQKLFDFHYNNSQTNFYYSVLYLANLLLE